MERATGATMPESEPAAVVPWSAVPAFVVAGVLAGLSLAGEVRSSVRPPRLGPAGTAVDLEPWRRVLADGDFVRAVAFTVWVAVAATVVSAVLALLLTAVLRRRGRSSAGVGLGTAVAAPHLVVATLAVLWLGPGGLAERLLGSLPWPLTGDRWGLGIVIVYAWKEAPFLTVLALAALDDATRDLERTAALLGAGRWARWRDVLLPRLALPLGAGGLVVAAFAIGAVEVPLVVGSSRPYTLGTYALAAVRLDGPVARADAAVANVTAAVLVALLAGAGLAVYRHRQRRPWQPGRGRLRRGGAERSPGSSKAAGRPGPARSARSSVAGGQLDAAGSTGNPEVVRPPGLASWRWSAGPNRDRWWSRRRATGSWLGGVVVSTLLVTPFGALVVYAVADQWFGSSLLPQRWGWRGVRAVAADPALVRAVVNSAQVAAGVAVAAVVLAWPAARFLARSRSAAAWAVVALPMLVPPLVMGDGLALWFVAAGVGDHLAAVALAHLAVSIPYAVLALVPAFTAELIEVDHSAAVLGAGPWRRTWQLLIPTARRPVAIALALAFTVSWSQYGTSLAIGGGTPMLPLVLVPFVGRDPQIAAVLALVFALPPAVLLALAARRET